MLPNLWREHATSRPLACLFLAWILLQAWQPFVMGMYGDDWGWFEAGEAGKTFSRERFFHPNLWDLNRSRPVYAVLYFLVSSLAGSSGFLVRFIASLTLLLTMIALFAFTRQVLRLMSFHHGAVPVTTSLLWLTMPWTVFTKVSPTAALSYFSAVFFFAGATVFLKSVEQRESNWVIPSLLQLLSYLTYEAFYFQYLSVLLLAYLYNRKQGHSNRGLVLPAAWFSVLQAVAIIYNRLAGSPKPGASIGVGLAKIVYNLTVGPVEVLVSSAYEWAPGICVAVTILLVLFRYAVREVQSDEARWYRAVWLSTLSGAALGLIVYAAANYSLTGRDAYTSFSSDFWLACAAAVVITVLWKQCYLQRRICQFALVLGAVSQCAAMGSRVFEWMMAARYQESWIAGAPIELIAATPANAVILYDGKTRYEGAWVFDRPSVLETQVHRKFGVSREFYTHWQSRVVWESTEVREDLGVLGRFKAPSSRRVDGPWYYWNPERGVFRQLTSRFQSEDTRLETQPLWEIMKHRHWAVVGAYRLRDRLTGRAWPP